MDVPGVVSGALGEESPVARIPLKGEDVLFLTPTRTLVYRAEGLLSDETVEEYLHDAERVSVREGRRKAKIELDYGTDGTETMEVPASRVDDVVPPVLAGVLNAAGVTGPGESVKGVYRFSELTLVVTSSRLVKHVGAAAWDEDYESIDYGDVTAFSAEEGSVASTLVFGTDGHTERIKVPNESFREVKEAVEEALFAAHDVSTPAEFAQLHEPEEPDPTPERDDMGFADSGIAPIEMSGADDDAEEQTRSETGASTATTTDSEPASEATTAESRGECAANAKDEERAWRERSRSEPERRGGDERREQNDRRRERTRDRTPAETREPEPAPEPSIPDDELLAELRDILVAVERQEDALASHSDAIARQRAELDAQEDRIAAQRDELAEQRQRIDDLIAAIRD
ncbi:DUF7115 domain-containing protein [Halocalculus aciditolerans]|uniref:DUF7115 domain-containing protein n=1 Tax=Halocalculus aciditolerans TaxID=1383812 RepID=A0A830F1B0_9EURY|nr:hypothetical protein [Halocalculus aciditolerans]GGL51672.1 hypothetical protein GCM10009039_07480 [Halocalculus aciditolerans]